MIMLIIDDLRDTMYITVALQGMYSMLEKTCKLAAIINQNNTDAVVLEYDALSLLSIAFQLHPMPVCNADATNKIKMVS